MLEQRVRQTAQLGHLDFYQRSGQHGAGSPFAIFEVCVVEDLPERLVKSVTPRLVVAVCLSDQQLNAIDGRLR